MSRGVKIRLASFVALAVLGVFYIGASYLGIVDKALGRGSTVTVSLPTTGGVYKGSEVDYRGVQIGKVDDIRPTAQGADIIVALRDKVEIPRSSQIQVANVSAVGEQYLNFVPTSGDGPYLQDGDRISGAQATLPPSTDLLLTNIDKFTRSINPEDLETVVDELGDMFQGNAENLRILVDSGTEFIDQATAHEDATIRLLNTSETVLDTQQAHSDDIRDFARGLAKVTKALKRSDGDLRDLFKEGPKTVSEVNSLVDKLRPVLPAFLLPLIEINQILDPRIPGLGQLLTTLPVVTKNSLIGVPGDGYGHITMEYNYNTPVCTQGYLPSAQWPSPLDTADHPLFPARCADPKAQRNYTADDAINQRGFNLLPPIHDQAPIYSAKPYGRSTPINASSTSTTSSTQSSLPSVVGQDGWESMFTGGGGG